MFGSISTTKIYRIGHKRDFRSENTISNLSSVAHNKVGNTVHSTARKFHNSKCIISDKHHKCTSEFPCHLIRRLLRAQSVIRSAFFISPSCNHLLENFFIAGTAPHLDLLLYWYPFRMVSLIISMGSYWHLCTASIWSWFYQGQHTWNIMATAVS